MITTIRGPGLKVLLDTEQIVPGDPGAGTPVLIEFSNGDTGTWNCVTSEGSTCDGTFPDEEQSAWLEKVSPQVEAWMEKHGV